MEKFAVDLEKVLDEFEFSEEREDRVALSVISNQSLPYICHVPRPSINNYRRPSFEPINLADADFAASPPHVLQNNLTVTTSTNAPDNNEPVLTSSVNNKLYDSTVHSYVIDDCIISNGFSVPSITIPLQLPIHISDDDGNNVLKTNRQSPRHSPKDSALCNSSSSSSSGREDEETSSLSDEKPDLLDYNPVTKSIVTDYRQIGCNNKNCDNDKFSDDPVDPDDDRYGLSRHLLPDVTSFSTTSLCKQSVLSHSVSTNLDIENKNSDKRNVVFDLIDTNRVNNSDVTKKSENSFSDDNLNNTNYTDTFGSVICCDKEVIVACNTDLRPNHETGEEEVVDIECSVIDDSTETETWIEPISGICDNEDKQRPSTESETIQGIDLEVNENNSHESNCYNSVDDSAITNSITTICSGTDNIKDITCSSNNNHNYDKSVSKDEDDKDIRLNSVSTVPAIGFVSSKEYFDSDCIDNEKEELEKYLEDFENSEETDFHRLESDSTDNDIDAAVTRDAAEFSGTHGLDEFVGVECNVKTTDSDVQINAKSSVLDELDETLRDFDDSDASVKSSDDCDNVKIKGIHSNKTLSTNESLLVDSFNSSKTDSLLRDPNHNVRDHDHGNESCFDIDNPKNFHSLSYLDTLEGRVANIKSIVTRSSDFSRGEESPDFKAMGNSVDKSVSIGDETAIDVPCQNHSTTESENFSAISIADGDERQRPNVSQEKDIAENFGDLRVTRPNVLELPAKITVDTDEVANKEELISPSTSTSPSSATIASAEGVEACLSSGGGSSPLPADPSSDDCQLGKVPPFWVPDSEALTCMQCQLKFTFVKRRHHCRACGQVLCSKCCSMKTKLVFIDGEARVCQPCYSIIGKVESPDGEKSPLGRQPNPNNPMEYCSTIPPLQQVAGSLHQPPPSVLVPVGVLKREGRVKSEVTKQVMFSDGIRPGGDLTELDGSAESRLPFRRPGRLTKRVGTPPGGTVNACSERIAVSSSSSRINGAGIENGNRRPLDPITQSFIPQMHSAGDTGNDEITSEAMRIACTSGLPPVIERVQGEVVYSRFDPAMLKTSMSDQDKPVKFAINRNLFVSVKKVMLDCCVNRECWCITSSGLACVGQDEVILVLECTPDETVPPRDVFLLINMLYIDASKGNTVSELSFTPSFSTDLLDSRSHGGFLYIRPSYQCTSKLVLPDPPYLVALLIHKWETPWARLFPIRLVLRLGAEYRYYPCPLISVRHRQPLYTDIGHTIINILADFRKYSYTLPTVRGLVVHMEDRQTTILLPRNRYDQVVRALNNSNDSVLAFGANLSLAADSHLVCMQSSDDENTYHTQAINIHNKPRKVTGASFVVFNGALKASCGLSGKSSIVEDGLMVQVPGDTMTALRSALRDMKDYTIRCGPHAEETVLLRWTADDTNFNIGVKSQIDGRPLDGVPSMRVHNGTDYSGQYRIIRWTEVFILQCEEVEGSGDPLDISRLSESLARATCMALVSYLDLLAAANLNAISIRAIIHPDHVGYEAGSNFEKLPPLYMKSLDDELVAVVHQAAVTCRDTPATLELLFRIMES